MVAGLSTTDLAVLIIVAGLLPVGPALWYVWELRDKPGVLWFMAGMVAAGGWTLTAGLNPLIEHPDVTITLFNLRFFAISIAVICWLMLAIEFTTRRHVSVRLFGLFLFVPLVTQLLLWTNPEHGFVFTLEAGVDQTRYILADPEPWWWIDSGYNYLLVVMGLGMWVNEYLSTSGARRRQTVTLLAATLILLVAGLTLSTDLLNPFSPLDPTPVSFTIAGVFIAYALFKYELFQVAPIAHERTIQEMDDAVVILNNDDVVTETNPAARELFDADEDPSGQHMYKFFSATPSVLEALEGTYDAHTEVELTVGGERFFDLNVTAIEEGRDMRGRVVVVRDITSLKQREEELDLAKQVLTRVFRHNVRNDLTAIRGYSETIRDRTGDEEIAEFASGILEKGDQLAVQSRKARYIEDILDTEAGTITVDLDTVVDRALEAYRESHPDVIFDVAVPAETTVVAHPKIETAIEQAVENAIEHHDGDPRIDIYVEPEEEWVRFYIEDDGPGIPETEIETIMEQEETKLQHGSGIGLWLIRWIIDHSGGGLLLENTDTGARVGMRLRRANERVHVIE